MAPKNSVFQWICNNKWFLAVSLLCFALFISTLTLSSKAHTCLYTKLPESRTELRHLYRKVISRLPRAVVPTNYNLKLDLNPYDTIFNGTMRIDVRVLSPTYLITFHSARVLNITSIILKQVDKVLSESFELHPDEELVKIHLRKQASIGIYELHIKYSRAADNGLVGLYVSKLASGSKMVASKFQPTYARQAFPCFDEPDFKATYDITIEKPLDAIALTNMNHLSSVIGQTEIMTFETSVPMSTYLVCFVVCKFQHEQVFIETNHIGTNFPMRVYYNGNKDEIKFALDIGKRATEFYINYYKVPYPLPKLDMIAIPDYVSGATEHWGLITYRETSFLIDAKTASARNMVNVANTIAHELAHMWFGNLVTMSWWDEIWLNEGFATYMQVKALNAIEPSWTMLDQFLTKTLHPVLVTDAKLSSHPIVQTAETPDEITAMFDVIAYNKGSSILRMLEGFVGEDNFQRGVTDYLNKYKFGNTVTRDFLSSLEPYFKAANPYLNLSYILDTWTTQSGYPVINVAPHDEPKTFVLTQKRFVLDADASGDELLNKWFVPITYKTNQGVNKKIVWLSDHEDRVKIRLGDGDEWFKVNNNQVGYYRVNYTEEMWEKLTQQLKNKSEQLTISDRAHLLNDAFALSAARQLAYDISLGLTSYLTVEDTLVPWEAAGSIFLGLEDRLSNSVASTHLHKFVQHLVKPMYNKMSWDKVIEKERATDTTLIMDRLLRMKILSLAAHFGLPDAVAMARKLMMQWLEHDGDEVNSIEPDLRDVVYYNGMKSASELEWNKLWNIYLNETDVQEKLKLRHALAAPRDTSILKRYLELAWDEKNVRSQDYLNVVQYISDNPSGVALVWDDVRNRWPQLVERFTLNSRYLGGVIPAITSSFNTELKLQEMEAFFEKYSEAGAGEAARRRALETVRTNIRWSSLCEPTVAAWLRQHAAHL